MVISILYFDIQYQYCLLNSLGIGWIGLKTLLDDWIIFLSWMPSFQCNVITVNRLTTRLAIYLCFMATLWRNWFRETHHQQPEVRPDEANMVCRLFLVLWCNPTVRLSNLSTVVSASTLDLTGLITPHSVSTMCQQRGKSWRWKVEKWWDGERDKLMVASVLGRAANGSEAW